MYDRVDAVYAVPFVRSTLNFTTMKNISSLTKKLSAIVALFSLILAAGVPVHALTPTSDIAGTKYEASIKALFQKGIVSGYPDGTFRPDDYINRAEFIGLALMAANIKPTPGLKNCFTDVTTQWFAGAVCFGKEKGFVSGYPDGLFRPTQPVKKVEAFAILVKVNQIRLEQTVKLPYKDIAADGWYITSLKAAYSHGLVEEKTTVFNPNEFIKRGRSADIMYRVIRNGLVPVAMLPTNPVTVPTEVVKNPPASPVVASTRENLVAADFTYLGAFRLPREANGASRFSYGGGAMAFNPRGDAAGAQDGFSGSLYIVGHENDQLVAEVTIPAPQKQVGQTVVGLPTAEYIHGFADITGGKAQIFDAGNGYRVDGLAYLDAQSPQQKDKLYWTARTYYNVDTSDDLSHGMSNANLSNPSADGMWRLANYHGLTTGGYIFTVPRYFADMYLGGKRLISGLTVQQGVSGTSQGPAFFAFAPWLNYNGSTPPPNGAALTAQKLVSYPYTGQPDPDRDPPSNFPDYQVPDSWDAAAWIDTPQKDAVVVVGHRAMGPTYYGDARPNDCTIYKGYHGEPYEPRVLFYSTADLALSAQGKKDPSAIVPYLEWNPSQYLVNTCMWQLTGVVYDEEHQRMYLLQQDADTVDGEPRPLIYVFSVK